MTETAGLETSDPSEVSAAADHLLWRHAVLIADAVEAAERAGGREAGRRVLEEHAARGTLAREATRRHVRTVRTLRRMGLARFERAMPIGVASLVLLNVQADEATKRALLDELLRTPLPRDEIRRRLRGPRAPEAWRRGSDLWWFTECDPRFGREGPDRLPGQVVLNLFDRFLPEGASVLSAMTGDGTVLDVAAATPKVGSYLGLDAKLDPDVAARHAGRVVEFDPLRPDWRSVCPKGVDLLVLTPPFFQFGVPGPGQSRYLEDYLDVMRRIVESAGSVLLPGGVFTLVTRQTADFNDTAPVCNLVRQLAEMIEDTGCEIFLGAPVVVVGRPGHRDHAGEWLVPVVRQVLIYRKIA